MRSDDSAKFFPYHYNKICPPTNISGLCNVVGQINPGPILAFLPFWVKTSAKSANQSVQVKDIGNKKFKYSCNLEEVI